MNNTHAVDSDSETLLASSQQQDNPDVDAWRYDKDDDDFDVDERIKILPCCVQPCFRSPRTAKHWKNVLTAYTLLFVSIGCIVAAAVLGSSHEGIDGRIDIAIFLVVGLLCGLPGCYYTIGVCCALRSTAPRALDKLFASFPGSSSAY
eukprot:TRINITY_DN4832_c0_g1_i2.p1 TRINITY_DN4832_c0_g1~~TRINITY_DN4832_c0_g1_i2.p1  ORF type:complete len:148 (+),score=15.94 TRINITY_DN4832_c0_g1_i2:75-518(+)